MPYNIAHNYCHTTILRSNDVRIMAVSLAYYQGNGLIFFPLNNYLLCNLKLHGPTWISVQNGSAGNNRLHDIQFDYGYKCLRIIWSNSKDPNKIGRCEGLAKVNSHILHTKEHVIHW